MLSVHDLLQNKGNYIWATAPDSSVYAALQLMAEKNVGALLVLESGKLAGIFSERDYARKVILKGKFSKDTPVHEVMTDKVTTVGSDKSIEWCMELMTKKHIRHLPVVDGDRLTGVISIGDIVKAIISDQKYTIGLLEEYITGGR